MMDKQNANIFLFKMMTFDSELVYNKEFLKTKIKPHGDEATDFYNQKIPKVDSNHTSLAVIGLYCAL